MSRLLSSALSLRRDPRILKLPPYLSFLCIAIGVVWLFLLPLNEYSRRTYISENALLPGQVHTYFGGSEQNIFRAYRHEVDDVVDKNNYEINDRLDKILTGVGLKVGRQNYTYHSAGDEYTGQNLYAILQAPRGDATEAIVLVAAWKTVEEQLNRNGVSLALTLAGHSGPRTSFSLFPQTARLAPRPGLMLTTMLITPTSVAPLPLKSGALQGAIAIDYPQEANFKAVHFIYDGPNGQLPNLDLINSIVSIAGGQMGISTTIQKMTQHKGSYPDRLQTMLRGMLNQGLGYAAGAHSSFIPYHVDAVTLQPYGEGWHDAMAMGRLVEGSFRSLNNLLEHLHQSFFFYLLMQTDRFVSIGTYLPSAMLLAANFTITAIYLWVKSGQSTEAQKPKGGKESAPVEAAQAGRDLFLPLGVVAICQAVSAIPLYLFNRLPAGLLSPAFAVFSVISAVLPFIISQLLTLVSKPTIQHFQLTKSFSLLVLGMCLSTLATLNFSLAFLVGLLASPLSFVKPVKNPVLRWSLAGLLNIVAPPTVVYAAAQVWGISIADLLREASFGWNVWGMYTPVVVWCLWWPAWLVGMVNVFGEVSV
ncbi:hypothetical protein NM208_g10020 [Fusarium decemcellulare]|uniref:Uncharacterized protein n=1 Tax=Fusarium decemcellulare TaxID=57161 RepID=A0ACC1RZK0_9HYPO|nr:hypothetical protein NM208_g10020 [Fusarium decemcellulare]